MLELLTRTRSGTSAPGWSFKLLVLVEMFKAHLVMIQRKSANPYARETEKGPRPGGLVLVRSSSTLG